MRPLAASAASMVVAAAIAACTPTTPVTPTSPGSVPLGSAAPPSTSSSSIAIPSSALAWDASLLDVLPPTVGGLSRTAEPDAFADLAADPTLGSNVESVAIAVFAGPSDLVTVSVARLRPGVFGDSFFRDWRASYDRAACASAGGVAGHAEAQIGGHATFITSCTGEVRAYHVHLEKRDLLVSLFAAGGDRLGEQLVGELPA